MGAGDDDDDDDGDYDDDDADDDHDVAAGRGVGQQHQQDHNELPKRVYSSNACKNIMHTKQKGNPTTNGGRPPWGGAI